MKTTIYTVGVYGSTSKQLFEKLTSNKIDTLIDIRRRRAVRGSEYAFANSNRLQNKLKELGINYSHIEDLSPTIAIVGIQQKEDKKLGIPTRQRNKLAEAFIKEYKTKILAKYDMAELVKQLEAFNSKRAALFCVEGTANACHRSLVAEKIKEQFGARVVNL
jgi:uncharacterized protein (DUF488 family)